MPIPTKTHHRAQAYLKAIAIATAIIRQSGTMTKEQVNGFQALYQYSRDYVEAGLKKDRLTMRAIESLEREFFTYWNEAISADVEQFWKAIAAQQLPYTRKSPLRDLLSKGRLRQVEQWIALFQSFEALKASGFLTAQFSAAEIRQIEALMKAEEQKRFELVNKCFRKKKIPASQFLQFGASMAFLERCDLTLKYFTEAERAAIFKLWKS